MATQTDADIEKLRAEMQTLRTDISQISETLKSIAGGYGDCGPASPRRMCRKVPRKPSIPPRMKSRSIPLRRPFRHSAWASSSACSSAASNFHADA